MTVLKKCNPLVATTLYVKLFHRLVRHLLRSVPFFVLKPAMAYSSWWPPTSYIEIDGHQSGSHALVSSPCSSRRLPPYSLFSVSKLKNHILLCSLLRNHYTTFIILVRLHTFFWFSLCSISDGKNQNCLCFLKMPVLHGFNSDIGIFSFFFNAPFLIMLKIQSAALTLICCADEIAIGPSVIAVSCSSAGNCS